MILSILFTADEESVSPVWGEATNAFSGWAKKYGVTLPSPFSSLTAGSELFLNVSFADKDIIEIFGALTEPFSGLDINITIERQPETYDPGSQRPFLPCLPGMPTST